MILHVSDILCSLVIFLALLVWTFIQGAKNERRRREEHLFRPRPHHRFTRS